MDASLSRIPVLGVLLLLSAWYWPTPAFARPVQVLHTNDLHSHFDRYPAVKATIERLRNQAAVQGIDSLVLDAGDFSEGSPYYLARQGQTSWDLMSEMGYDAVTLGNHDWTTGTAALDQHLGLVREDFTVLGANFIFHPRFQSLTQHLKPYAEFTRAGIKIAVLGITTDEWLYSWRAEDGMILAPETALAHLPALRARNDFVIALTHIGKDNDLSLGKHSVGLDLIVGGHSHDALEQPLLTDPWFDDAVPVVQAGDWGRFVGVTWVDLEPGQPLRLIESRLVPVEPSQGQDAAISAQVASARQWLRDRYGAEWLERVPGWTRVRLEPQTSMEQPGAWNSFAAEAFRVSTNSDIGVDVPAFSENGLAPGPVTQLDLFALYPRVFDFADGLGWKVWTARVEGRALELLVKEANELGQVLTFAGLTYKLKDGKLESLRVQGEPIAADRKYTIAMPEGVGLASRNLSWVFRLLLQDARSTDQAIWTTLSDHLARVGTIQAPR